MDPDSKPGPAVAGFPVLSPAAGYSDVQSAAGPSPVRRAGECKPAVTAEQPEVIVAAPGWRRFVPGAEAVVRRAAAIAGGATTIVLDSDQAVRRLNARHRGIDRPTNVLTFDGGDVVLALGVVRREAAAERRRPAHHLAHLVVHAALHLQGHDHTHPGDARRMEMAEARLLSRLRVPNPWKARP